MITQKERMTILGAIGEKIFCNFANEQGYKVEQSINPFDKTKDLKINGKSVEIKTQVPFITKNSLTLKSNQLKKARKVDKLIFITCPCKSSPDEGYIYEVDPKAFIIEEYLTKKDNKLMYLISRTQKAVRKIAKCKPEEIAELNKYRTDF
jgi:hypothetical protein